MTVSEDAPISRRWSDHRGEVLLLLTNGLVLYRTDPGFPWVRAAWGEDNAETIAAREQLTERSAA